eukprot:NODE_7042_length_798_cov_30.597037_g6803_i0.p1 GENE.NODE_7042_length_798_cov_30.597037_g6803_i0~~NODE_7042_length_798_cov_30.597037_g6803_i0.p1  ORF type:complete len:205 (-),score=71.61 NODE_7042_length_798_cov_30.597037_g6803_i0:183-734(-)
MPRRDQRGSSESDSQVDDEWDRVLDHQIKMNKQTTSTNKGASVAIAITVSFLPCYLYQAVMDLPWMENLPIYLIFPCVSAAALTLAYQETFQAKYTGTPGSNVKKEDEAAEKILRYQMAIGYSLFFCNALFLALVLFFQFYLLRAFDKRVAFSVSFIASSALVYWVSFENGKTVARRIQGKRV